MSVRSSHSSACNKSAFPGSLFGSAIGSPVGGFWNRLAVSPPRTPPTTSSQYDPMPPEFDIDAGPRATATASQLDSVFPSWVHNLSDAVLVTFVQSTDVVTLRSSPLLQCTNVVHPTMVRADAASWRMMACDISGTCGHLFTLSHRGKHTCRIEVTLEGDDIGKVVVVQPEYSALAVSSNLCSPSSLLVFKDVRERVKTLRSLQNEIAISSEVGYVPTQELVATSALDKLVLTTDHSPEAVIARRHWKLTKMLLTNLSTATADCVDAYTRSEFRRIGGSMVGSDAWRREL